MIVKALMEDTSLNPAFQAEHGLSLYIEANGHNILFDAGQSPLFAQNAVKLGVDLSKVDFAVLSHAHYDHSGGLRTFLSLNPDAPVYVSRFAFDECLNNAGEPIGLDDTLQGDPRLVFVKDSLMLAEGFEIFSGKERTLMQPVESFGLKTRRGGTVIPDDFRHEQYLLVTQGNKRVLISGCSHKGIINIAHWFRPDVLIGGFHYVKLDPQGDGKAALDAATDELLRCPTVYHTCHCTGVPQYQYLKVRMQARLFYISAGQEITV